MAVRVVVAVGRAAALCDNRAVGILRVEENVQRPTAPAGPEGVKRSAHPAAVHV